MASNIVEELNAVTASDIGDEVATSSHENEIKLKFYEELVSVLKPKQNVIECRAIWCKYRNSFKLSARRTARKGMLNTITTQSDITWFNH